LLAGSPSPPLESRTTSFRRRPTPFSFPACARPPPRSTLFPYTTLFRSLRARPASLRLPPTSALPPSPIRAPRSRGPDRPGKRERSEEHTSELQSLRHLVCRLLLEKKKVVDERQRQDDVRVASVEQGPIV